MADPYKLEYHMEEKKKPADAEQVFKYPECIKGGNHVGEVLNLVCLEPKCVEKSIICGICYDEEHKGHKIKPLKMVINHSKTYLKDLTPLDLDTAGLKEIISNTKGDMMKGMDEFQGKMQTALDSIRALINGIFIKIGDQVEIKAGSSS